MLVKALYYLYQRAQYNLNLLSANAHAFRFYFDGSLSPDERQTDFVKMKTAVVCASGLAEDLGLTDDAIGFQGGLMRRLEARHK